MTNEKASFTAVASATLRADNHTDESRTVDISADVNLSGTEVTGFSNGIAAPVGDSGAVCRFSESYGNNISTDFNSFPDADAQVAALREINAFIAAVRASAPGAFNLTPRQDDENR